MLRTRLLVCLIALLPLTGLKGQSFFQFNDNTLVLDNGIIKREIRYNKEKGSFNSLSYSLHGSEREFLFASSEEFSFEIDGQVLNGNSGWDLVSVGEAAAPFEGKGALVTLERRDPDVRIEIKYLLYPGLPIIRKNITFINMGKTQYVIESPDLESIRFQEHSQHVWVMNDYARQKHLGQFVGNWFDPVVVIHAAKYNNGILLGNEAPGVMKRTTAFLKPNLLTAGLTHKDQNFAFRKYLNPDENWESTWVFTMLYHDSPDPMAILNGPLSDYVRKHMGIRLNQIPSRPVFVYNSWQPFMKDINEKLIYELVDAAAECGIEEFVIDDGWQTNYGDWIIDKNKFPNGLKPVFDYIKSKGMKPGLWISLGAAEAESQIFKQHPEWRILSKDGEPISVHSDQIKKHFSMCMTTGYYDYIKEVILNLVKEHGLEYIKGDFAVVTGAYTTDKTRSGCHAPGHNHTDRNESLLTLYQRTWQLFDDLHAEAPDLFIDCTYETMGDLQLIDLDMCKHAEGNWLSNFNDPAAIGSFRVRQMAWWRTPVIPATALVIGNLRIDDPNFELSLMSLTGALPIVLGDPRALNPGQRARIKSWVTWLRKIEEMHNYTLYRQDLQGYGEPAEGSWDGFQRINTDTMSGGLVGIFRQNSKENERWVTVQFLEPDAMYAVYRAPEGKRLLKATGRELQEKGFKVKLPQALDGAIFEITKIN